MLGCGVVCGGVLWSCCVVVLGVWLSLLAPLSVWGPQHFWGCGCWCVSLLPTFGLAVVPSVSLVWFLEVRRARSARACSCVVCPLVCLGPQHFWGVAIGRDGHLGGFAFTSPGRRLTLWHVAGRDSMQVGRRVGMSAACTPSQVAHLHRGPYTSSVVLSIP